MNIVKRFFVWMLVALSSTVMTAQPINSLECIERDNLATLVDTPQPEIADKEELARLEKAFQLQANPSDYQLRHKTFKLMDLTAQPTSVIDSVTLQELEILHGSTSSPANCLVHALSNAVTTQAGMIMLMKAFCEISADPIVLQTRKACLEMLLADQELSAEVTIILQKLFDAQKLLTSFEGQDAIGDAYRENMGIGFLGYLMPSLAQKIDANKYTAGVQFYEHQAVSISGFSPSAPVLQATLYASYMEGLRGISTLAVRVSNLANPSLFNKIKNKAALMFLHRTFPQWKKAWAGGFKMSLISTAFGVPAFMGYIIKQTHSGSISLPNKGWLQKRTVIGAAGALTAGWAVYYASQVRKAYQLQSAKVKFMHAKLCAVAQYVQALDQLKALCENNPLLRSTLRTLPALNTALGDGAPGDYHILLDQLRSDTFKGEPSFWANGGILTSTFALFNQHRKQLMTGLATLGELDVLYATSQLVQASTAERPWCVAEFSDAATPSLAIADVWHPMITTQPVLNDVALGTLGVPSTMIISGPNAGGKSTVMKSTVVATLCATALGVAPAAMILLTPFAKIVTYMNITDDLAQGSSYFKAGVLRAKQVMAQVDQAVTDGGFVFVGLDEVFNGTSAQEGEASAATLVETIGMTPSTLQISVTHFKQVTELGDEHPQQCANFKVTVRKDDDGSLHYPFKLEAGKSDQIIAFDVLANEGFDEEFVQKARARVKRRAPVVAPTALAA